MRRISATWALVVAPALWLATGGLAAAQGGKGGGGGGGGGNAGQAAGALYGDLYVIERDGTGVPVTRNVSYTSPETGATVTVACVQPLALSCERLPLWAESPGFDPELYDPCAVYTPYTDQIQEVKFGRESVSRAPATVIDKAYAEALDAISSASAGQCVCDYQTAFCDTNARDSRAVKLDPAGRLTLCLARETTPASYAWKTIDAPLENLGLYRALMTRGCYGKVTGEAVGEEGVRALVTTALDPSGIFYLGSSGLGHLICDFPAGTTLPNSAEEAAAAEAACTVTPDPVGGTPDEPCWWETAITPGGSQPGEGVARDDMLSAAVFLAAGADKTSPVTLDEIVNVNNYLGVNLWTYTKVKKTQVLTIKYFPFTASGGPGGWLGYTRGIDACVPGTISELLVAAGEGFARAGVDVFGGPPDGVDLLSVGISVCRDGAILTSDGQGRVVCNDSALNPVYGPGHILGCGGANGFAQAAEDARKTIWYLHNWEQPELAY
jgi:hypothetical protein